MWQTRTICTFVAATVPVETEGEISPLLEQAQRIGDPPDEATGQQTGGSPARSGQAAGLSTETDEEGRVRHVAAVDPNPGTFERFMGSFGTPQRWAGR